MIGLVPAVVRRSFAEFLAIPTVMFSGFVALAAGMIAIDKADVAGTRGVRETITRVGFSDAETTGVLLETIATSLIAVTGITFSVLLLVVQQSATTLTHAVLDQFLRRRANQAILGAFVGVSLYLLVVLSTVGRDFNPVLSATVGLALSIGALYLLVVLIYTAIDQMRPSEIIKQIHNEILRAYDYQHALLAATRRSALGTSAAITVCSTGDGFVTRVDVDALASIVASDPDGEVILKVSTGTYVALGDALAVTTSGEPTAQAVREAIRLEAVRDIRVDPCYGIESLINISWTSISTSKQDAAPGRLVILTLRDLFGRLTELKGDLDVMARDNPVVYDHDVDTAMWDAVDSLAEVCSESMQSHNLAEIVRSLAAVCSRLDEADQGRVAEAAMRIVSGLGDHVLTKSLDSAMVELADTLEHRHLAESHRLRVARDELASTIGVLNSRSTRVPDR